MRIKVVEHEISDHQYIFSFSLKRTVREIFAKNRKILDKQKIDQSETSKLEELFFSKTVRFWEKFIRTKVMEHEISDHQCTFSFSLRRIVREIFAKNRKKT